MDKPLIWLHGEVKTPPFLLVLALRVVCYYAGFSKVKSYSCLIRVQCPLLENDATSFVLMIPM